ncbi:MAG: carboxypeptidase regulatory-like domain-containing protein [Chloroflexi bacterium]|nr:carboxypeptidase regulatory-like domain-containing protein [Chloroflexota bacterium]
MTLRAVDAVLTRQVFITGTIQDSLSAQPILDPTVISLRFQAAPQRPYPLYLRKTSDGNYAFFGNPSADLPILSGAETLNLELTVSSARYQTITVSISLGSADTAPGEITRVIDNQTVILPARPALPRVVNVVLTPVPLTLIGRVLRADDLNTAIAGATITVTAPAVVGPVTSNSQGNFTLANLPVAEEITVSVSHVDFSPLNTTIRLDYRQPVNEQYFSLT